MVFVGEYAATANAGSLPTGLLGNSIGEAAFMTGMERNSDIVRMSSYAPLFAYVGYTQWNPDLIGFEPAQLISWGVSMVLPDPLVGWWSGCLRPGLVSIR